MLKKLLSKFQPEWTPRLLDVCGFGCIIVAVGIAFGPAPGLAATGVALLLIGWAVA
ncbi:MAG TPA: hypothetical protein VMW79_06070 [Anaerolineae bacterium]|nr:hypothetical protein [Anaerolineae bacterium]HUW96000.1 hypothetical protein [Anaerolineae bacterium]